MGEMGEVLGFFRDDPDAYFRTDREREAAKRDLDPDEIERFIAARKTARDQKEWAKADQIRIDLATRGVILKDSPTGTTWTVE